MSLRSADLLAGEIDQCFRQLPISLVVHLVNGLILVSVLWGAVDEPRLFAWLAVVLVVVAVRYVFWRVYNDPGRRARVSDAVWKRVVVWGACAGGCALGSAGILLFQSDSFPHQVFLAFMLGGMLAGAVSTLSSIKAAYRFYAIPIAVPLALQFILQGDRVHLIMGLMILVFGTAMLTSSALVHRIYRNAVELRLQLDSSVQAGDALRQMVHVDELTRIANRRLFESALATEWRRAGREGTVLAVVMADIDHFKTYNDLYGHPAGDRCLIRVAGAMAGTVRRPGDIAARIGGEEFAFLLPGTTLEAAAMVAERIRVNVVDLRAPHAASPVADSVTVSLGVAAVSPSAETSSLDLVRAADIALYAAKRRGRNRVSCHPFDKQNALVDIA